MKTVKKLIEFALPLGAIDTASAREKQFPMNTPSLSPNKE